MDGENLSSFSDLWFIILSNDMYINSLAEFEIHEDTKFEKFERFLELKSYQYPVSL